MEYQRKLLATFGNGKGPKVRREDMKGGGEKEGGGKKGKGRGGGRKGGWVEGGGGEERGKVDGERRGGREERDGIREYCSSCM